MMYEFKILCCVILSSALQSFCLNNNSLHENGCDNWKSYKDEKCFKLFDSFKTFDDANQFCKNQKANSNLVSIASQEEQDFIANYLFEKQKIVDNVWIGAKRNAFNDTKFIYEDGTKFSYNNLDISDFNENKHDCIEMRSDGFHSLKNKGKWKIISCNKRNLVLCQYPQDWSEVHTERELIKLRDEFRKYVNFSKENLKQLSNSIINHFQTIVPIGMIYIELPTQLNPKQLWPLFQWADVSTQYSGLFFRVVGGNASSFGVIQEENDKRLTYVKDHQITTRYWNTISIPKDGRASNLIYTGDYPGTGAINNMHLSFSVNSGEVRPRNQAIRVWKRVK